MFGEERHVRISPGNSLLVGIMNDLRLYIFTKYAVMDKKSFISENKANLVICRKLSGNTNKLFRMNLVVSKVTEKKNTAEIGYK